MFRLLRTSSVARLSRPSRNFVVPSHRFRNMSTVTTDSSIELVHTEAGPAALGPYSQAVKCGDLLFVSGCIPLNPATKAIVTGPIEEQATQSLQNLKVIVEGGGSSLGKVVKTLVFLKSMDDFAAFNTIYAKFFGSHKPARSCVQVAKLPADVSVEVECIASLK